MRARTAAGRFPQAEGRDYHAQRRLGPGRLVRRATEVPPAQVRSVSGGRGYALVALTH